MTKSTTVVSKAFVAIVAAAMVFSLVAPAAKAATAEELQAQITALMAQISALSGTTAPAAGAMMSSCAAIPAPLTMNASGANVTALQNFLIKAGQSIPAGATGFFGGQTKSALAAWQTANGVSPAAGYYGPVTAAAIAAKCVPTTPGTGTTTPTTPGTSADLQGEGELTAFEINDEEDEVSEGAEDEVIATYTLEAEDGDIEIDRMDFTLEVGGAAPANEELDPWDVFEAVSVWVDGKKVGEFDASDEDEYLNEDTGTFRFSGLGLVLPEDEEVEVSLAVTVMSSVDGSDVANGADWDITVDEVRYFDADGVATDEDGGTAIDDLGTSAATITFDIVVEGRDDDATIESNTTSPDAATLKVEEDSSESEELSVHVFDIEVDEDSSDLVLDDAYVWVTVGNPASASTSITAEDVIADIMLTIDGQTETGDEVGSNHSTAIAAGASLRVGFLFEFDGLDLEAGETYEAEVAMTFEGQDDFANFQNGVTIETDVNAQELGAKWQVEGLDNDFVLTGNDSSEEHTLATVVPVISNVTSEVDRNEAGDAGTISFEFNVEADGEDDVTLALGNIVRTLTGGTATTSAVTSLSKVSGDATVAGGVWTIQDGDDATFVLDVTFTASSSLQNGTYRVALDSILGVEVDQTSAGMSLTK